MPNGIYPLSLPLYLFAYVLHCAYVFIVLAYLLVISVLATLRQQPCGCIPGSSLLLSIWVYCVGGGKIRVLKSPGQMGLYLPGACIVLAFGKSIMPA